jgi:hypothetical protein
MKYFLRKTILLTLSFLLVCSVLSPFALAKEESIKSEQEEIEELAEALEFIYDEAATLDDHGNIIDLDFEKIEKEFGTDSELTELKELFKQLEKDNKQRNYTLANPLAGDITPMHHLDNTPNFDRCMNSKVRSEFTTAISVFAVATFLEALKHKEFTKAATTLIKAGIKGSPIGIAATLAVLSAQCLAQEGWS